jgi:hypothetical protein
MTPPLRGYGREERLEKVAGAFEEKSKKIEGGCFLRKVNLKMVLGGYEFLIK